MLLAAALVFELSRESLAGTHYRYREHVNGLPTETYVTTKSPFPAAQPRREGQAEGLRFSEGRIIRRRIVRDNLFEPYAYDYDIETGALIRRTPLFFRARPARVFDPNPVVTLNDPALQDFNDSASAVPAAAYKDVVLPDQALHGPHVRLIDRQPRNIAPPEGALVFDREHDGFEDVAAYFHIDRSQRHLQALGYTGMRAVVPYAIEVDAHAANGADNSYFIPSSTEAGTGTLYFGEGGTDDAEDADLLVHEYAHAIIEWIAPGTFGGAFASEARAVGEGIGDYWAFSAHIAARRASGRDPYCFADWDARCWEDAASESCGYAEGTDCLRRLDSTKTMADYETSETSGVEHRNGAIWASALREIHEKLGRSVTDTLVIESLFGAPPRPTFAVMAERLLQADRLLYQAAHAGAICSAMVMRGIVTQCDTTPRGERTLFQANERGVPIPENSPIGVTSSITIDDPREIQEIYVRVDVDHPSRGDLFVELTAPDGTKIVLHQLSSSRTAGIHATFGLDAVPAQSLDVLRGRNAAGTWTLFVADRRPRDAGTFESWGLEIRFAGDEPQTTRPQLSSHVVPVVAHLFGQNGSYVSDVRIANLNVTRQTVRLIFTRSGEDGSTSFAMQQISLHAGQTIALDDVVGRTFHTFGSGTLEVQGFVVVTSRMYVETDEGTLGQSISATEGSAGSLFVAPFAQEGSRYNFGVAALGQAGGIVRISGQGWEEQVPVAPYSNVQIPVPPSDLIEARVIDGDAVISAYLSQIDSGGDAMFIPAEEIRSPRPRCFPAITEQTSGAPEWRSDVWFASREAHTLRVWRTMFGAGVEITIPAAYEDVLARLFHRTFTTAVLCTVIPEGVFAFSRIVHGTTTQALPMLQDDDDHRRHLLFIENNERYRTNVGIVSTGTSIVTFVVLDSAGTEIERRRLKVDPGVHQVPVTARVTNGHVVVIREHGVGTVYASLIDTRSGDATFFPGQ
ncbi:MAG: proprotein convertase P-domain-containing protein [Thermoanaerobaculia bacterium]